MAYRDLVNDYDVTPTMTAAQRRTAFQQALRDAAATRRPLHVPAGVYVVDGTLDARGTGLRIIGDGPQSSRIKCSGNNVPLLRVGGEFQSFDGISLEYTTQQPATATNATCVEHWSSKYSRFTDIYTYGGARHWHIPQAEAVPGSGINTGAFSNSYTNLRGLGATINYIHMSGHVGYWTGNHWSNVYFNNKVGSVIGLTGPAVYFNNGDENVINQLNVEDIDLSVPGSPDRVVQFSNRATVVNGLHFERVKPASSGATVVHVGSLSKTVINGMSVVWSDFTDATKGNRSIFRLYQGRLECHGLNLHNVQRQAGVSVYLVDVSDPASRSKAVVTLADYDATCSATSSMGTSGVTWATGPFLAGNAVNDTASAVTVT